MTQTPAGKIRAVFIIDDLGLGGAQRQLVEILKGFPRDAWELFVISLSSEKNAYRQALLDAGIPLTEIDHRGAWSWATLGQVRARISEIRPQIVYTWLFTAELYGRLAAMTCGVPAVISAMRNTIDDMPAHYRLASQGLALGTDRITVNVEAIRTGLVNVWKIPDRKIVTIYNGIDLEHFPILPDASRFKESMGVPADGIAAGMVARMAPQKDHATLIEAAARVIREFPRAHFVFAGDGPLRDALVERVAELRIQSHVHFLGPRRDAWELMNGFDLCVLSTHFEGCSNVIMEGMAAAKPVIATAVGGNAELIRDGETGYVVPHQNPELLADRILELMRDPHKAEQMGRAGRLRVEQDFSIARTIQKTEELFRDVLKNKKH